MNLGLAAILLLLAHTAGLSGGDYVVKEGVLHGRLSFQQGELSALVGSAGGDLSRALGVELKTAGRTCVPERFRSEPEEEDGARVRFEARCDLVGGELVQLKLGFLETGAGGHRHYYELRAGGSPLEGIAYQGASELRFTVESRVTPSWLGWAASIWLVLTSLGLGLGTRRRTMEVALVGAVTGVLLVGVGAAAALVPRGGYFGLAAPIFAFYLAAEAYGSRHPPRRLVLAVPAGMLLALLFLAGGLGEGAAEDRVVRGLISFAGLGLAPGLALLALSGLVSVRWPRGASAVAALGAVVALVVALL